MWFSQLPTIVCLNFTVQNMSNQKQPVLLGVVSSTTPKVPKSGLNLRKNVLFE